MKKIIIELILITMGILFSVGVIAQGPPSPPAGQGTSGDQSPAGGPTGAPVEPGTDVLLILAIGYSITKFQDVRKMQRF